DAPASLLLNRVPNRGHWIAFRLGSGWGADALHASIRLERDGRLLRRDARSAFGYLSASDPTVHFGLGDSDAPVEEVTVTWPDGAVERYGPFEVDRVHGIEEGRNGRRGTRER
ncbi:MAG: ASPIC/UnbV domain-containing protein, partial [Planctomycetota bacterium JB042]